MTDFSTDITHLIAAAAAAVKEYEYDLKIFIEKHRLCCAPDELVLRLDFSFGNHGIEVVVNPSQLSQHKDPEGYADELVTAACESLRETLIEAGKPT